MAASPIQARCRRCSGELFLFEVVEAKTGECPRCRWPLSPDWNPLLFEEARRADDAQRHLVSALRRLVSLPGNLEILPHSVLRNVTEGVGWEMATDPALLRDEVRRLREQIDAWQRLAPGERTPEGKASITQALRGLGSRLRHLGQALDTRQELEAGDEERDRPAGRAAREAAARLDEAADASAFDTDSARQQLQAGLDAADQLAAAHSPAPERREQQVNGTSR